MKSTTISTISTEKRCTYTVREGPGLVSGPEESGEGASPIQSGTLALCGHWTTHFTHLSVSPWAQHAAIKRHCPWALQPDKSP